MQYSQKAFNNIVYILNCFHKFAAVLVRLPYSGTAIKRNQVRNTDSPAAVSSKKL